MRSARWAALMFVLAAVPAIAADSGPAGIYRIRQMEMAGGLELGRDGRFRYALEYGAASEFAEGKWTSDGKAVRLTSEPMPRPPAFLLLRDDPAPRGELWLTVEKASMDWGGGLRAIAMVEGSHEPLLVAARSDGRVDTGGRVVTSIAPLVPVYGTPAGRFTLSTDRGHRLTLRFVPNDLGRAAFHGETLLPDGRDLVMKRYDASIRFVRVRP